MDHKKRERELEPAADEDVFARFLGGDRSQFEIIVQRYKDRAYWIAFNIVRSHEEARDMAQEAFARCFISASSFDLSMKFSTWFFRILVNLCIDSTRKGKLRKTVSTDDTGDLPGGASDPSEDAEARDNRVKVRQVLRMLPQHHRAILVLRDLQGLSNLEIAEILDTNHATARWRLHRARLKFKETWEEVFGPWE